MKNKLLLMFSFILMSIFLNNVSAMPDIFTYNNTISYSIKDITNIINTKNGYTIVSSQNKDTIIYNYDKENKLQTTKKIASLKNAQIINYNDNLLIAGIKGNNLTIYLLDPHLRVIKYRETSYIVSAKNTINTNLYNNKIYLSITKNSILSTNTIYEIDESLNITANNFSSYPNIKDILASNYGLIKYNHTSIEDSFVTYTSGTKLNNQYIFIGHLANTPVLSIYDNDTLLSYTLNENYKTYHKILIIKDKISILASDNNHNTFYLLLNKEGKILHEEPISINGNPITNMYKVGDSLLFTSTINDKTYIADYHYSLTISYDNLPFGTIVTESTSSEFKEVPLNISSNSGYEISEIKVVDAHGNVIPIHNFAFTMPDTDVHINVIYSETVLNPETMDIIYLLIIILIISFVLLHFFYKKFAWLK